MKRIASASLILTAIMVMSGCASLSPSNDSQRYQAAIRDAAVIEPTEVKPLPVIASDKVRVVTWTKFPDSYPLGQPTKLKWGEVWVTQDQVVQTRCRSFAPDKVMSDVQQLLGLPLNCDEKRHFVTLEVDAAALFRPCANPSLQATTCEAGLPKTVAPDHAAWYAKQTSQSYQTQNGFPWTRLGYTYNWKAGADEVGVAELVIKAGAQVLPVAMAETAEYCAR